MPHCLVTALSTPALQKPPRSTASASGRPSHPCDHQRGRRMSPAAHPRPWSFCGNMKVGALGASFQDLYLGVPARTIRNLCKLYTLVYMYVCRNPHRFLLEGICNFEMCSWLASSAAIYMVICPLFFSCFCNSHDQLEESFSRYMN